MEKQGGKITGGRDQKDDAATHAKPRKGRQSSYAKSAETEIRVMEAAVACLCEKGFHALTLQRVADRAGMTRSAIQYYANTTEVLLLGLQEYLVDKIWGEELRRSVALAPGADNHARAIDMIVDLVASPYFVAWNELLIAARTVEKLQSVCSRGAYLREQINTRLTQMFHGDVDDETLASFKALDDLFVMVLHAATFVTFDKDSRARINAAISMLRDIYVRFHTDPVALLTIIKARD